MKWINTFLFGALIGAIGVIVYQKSIIPDPALITTPQPALVALTTPCEVVAPIETTTPIVIATRPADPGATPPATTSPPASDKLLIPVSGVNASQLSDTFDQARGAERRHEALDIMAPRGTQVLAVADGKVAKLFNSKPGGLTVYQFDLSERFAYYYAHLDRYAEGVKEGTSLKRGDLVGYVGATGNANPASPHLHFAIFELGPEKQWWKGRPINPFTLLGGVRHP